MISYMFLVLYRYIDIKKTFKIEINKKLFIISSILYIFLTIIYMLNNTLINIIVIIIIMSTFILNYKETIKNIINTIKLKIRNI